LGLLGGAAELTRKGLPGLDPAELRNATFGISIEPEGGSPTGRPTGPAIHGKLIPATL
jgi:anti-sigma-K factor RskA